MSECEQFAGGPACHCCHWSEHESNENATLLIYSLYHMELNAVDKLHSESFDVAPENYGTPIIEFSLALIIHSYFLIKSELTKTSYKWA
jgi:hypothetical protein